MTKPPLRHEEVQRILRGLEPLSKERRIVLVGGQAIAFWTAFLRRRRRSMQTPLLASKDIDFEGASQSARKAGALLGGRVRIPTLDDHTPNTGIVLFKDADGIDREIDFIEAPLGLRARDVRETAVELTIPGRGRQRDIPVWVMHPERCMESRIYNVVDLKTTGRVAIEQLEVSVVCAREWSRFLLDEGSASKRERVRAVLRLNERIFRKCLRDQTFRAVSLDHGVDPFEAVLLDDRLPTEFRGRRYSQMTERLEERRKRDERNRARYQHRRNIKRPT